MTTKEAVAQRIIDLCAERNIAVNALANISGVSPSTVYSKASSLDGQHLTEEGHRALCEAVLKSIVSMDMKN